MKQHLILSCSSIPTFFKQSSYLYSDSITRARLITRILRTTGMSLRKGIYRNASSLGNLFHIGRSSASSMCLERIWVQFHRRGSFVIFSSWPFVKARASSSTTSPATRIYAASYNSSRPSTSLVKDSLKIEPIFTNRMKHKILLVGGVETKGKH
ncbi:hypothetical protein HanHA300_Chr01g0007071 [Helianthus annuus]|nr:hypothetical protein HanHA300_Chr01g0007071 [Helianthus annuus]KAJ0625987.1 hypothetical protein HanHA89_Chr01g0007811 [Helianthus annuus]KAJ0782335.1 hypothetical protein HanLR1_Chr01g0006901 [Helianthus annuus]